MFDEASLYPKALRDPTTCTFTDVCRTCLKSMHQGKQPGNRLANFQYYAYDELPEDVASAFERASLFDLMLVARACMTKISYLFNHKVGVSNGTQQGFIRGNVAVLPQDTMKIWDVIPRGRDEIREALCTLLISSGATATRENIE